MKGVVDKASTAVVLVSNVTILLIIFCVHNGRQSFWLLPLGLYSITGIFADSAFGSQQSVIPKHASQMMFWLSLLASMATTVMAMLGGT